MMNWKLITKDSAKQPADGCYSNWKEQIAEECYFQCVYCSIHEAQFGGVDHYHIDHFKPKMKFPELENNIRNLFYSCPVCNRFKSDDWPGEPDLHSISYIDPSENDYAELFELDANYEIIGKDIAPNYIATRLYLNRAQLIFERRESQQRMRETKIRESINTLLNQIGKCDIHFALEILICVTQVYNNLLSLENRRREIRPYGLEDIRRQ